jgi:hypothetical protein
VGRGRVREGVEAIMVLAAGASVFWLALLLSADSLLACVVTGVLTTNRRCSSPHLPGFSSDAIRQSGRVSISGRSLRLVWEGLQ